MWTIKCIKCGGEFEQKTCERTCGCKRYIRPSSICQKFKDRAFHIYVQDFRRRHQNPIYQFIREFITTEWWTKPIQFYQQALEYGCICNLSVNQDEAPHDKEICQCECHS